MLCPRPLSFAGTIVWLSADPDPRPRSTKLFLRLGGLVRHLQEWVRGEKVIPSLSFHRFCRMAEDAASWGGPLAPVASTAAEIAHALLAPPPASVGAPATLPEPLCLKAGREAAAPFLGLFALRLAAPARAEAHPLYPLLATLLRRPAVPGRQCGLASLLQGRFQPKCCLALVTHETEQQLLFLLRAVPAVEAARYTTWLLDDALPPCDSPPTDANRRPQAVLSAPRDLVRFCCGYEDPSKHAAHAAATFSPPSSHSRAFGCDRESVLVAVAHRAGSLPRSASSSALAVAPDSPRGAFLRALVLDWVLFRPGGSLVHLLPALRLAASGALGHSTPVALGGTAHASAEFPDGLQVASFVPAADLSPAQLAGRAEVVWALWQASLAADAAWAACDSGAPTDAPLAAAEPGAPLLRADGRASTAAAAVALALAALGAARTPDGAAGPEDCLALPTAPATLAKAAVQASEWLCSCVLPLLHSAKAAVASASAEAPGAAKRPRQPPSAPAPPATHSPAPAPAPPAAAAAAAAGRGPPTVAPGQGPPPKRQQQAPSWPTALAPPGSSLAAALSDAAAAASRASSLALDARRLPRAGAAAAAAANDVATKAAHASGRAAAKVSSAVAALATAASAPSLELVASTSAALGRHMHDDAFGRLHAANPGGAAAAASAAAARQLMGAAECVWESGDATAAAVGTLVGIIGKTAEGTESPLRAWLRGTAPLPPEPSRAAAALAGLDGCWGGLSSGLAAGAVTVELLRQSCACTDASRRDLAAASLLALLLSHCALTGTVSIVRHPWPASAASSSASSSSSSAGGSSSESGEPCLPALTESTPLGRVAGRMLSRAWGHAQTSGLLLAVALPASAGAAEPSSLGLPPMVSVARWTLGCLQLAAAAGEAADSAPLALSRLAAALGAAGTGADRARESVAAAAGARQMFSSLGSDAASQTGWSTALALRGPHTAPDVVSLSCHRAGLLAQWLIAMASPAASKAATKEAAADATALVAALGGPGSAACRGWAWLLSRSVAVLQAAAPRSLTGQDKRKANNTLKQIRADAAAAALAVHLAQDQNHADGGSEALARAIAAGAGLASLADAFASDILADSATLLGTPASDIFGESTIAP